MASKKSLIVLVIIALILVVVAISLRILDSNNVPTSAGESTSNPGNGEVGVTILQPSVEDKMADNTGESQP